jgi:hypothetical protein
MDDEEGETRKAAWPSISWHNVGDILRDITVIL